MGLAILPELVLTDFEGVSVEVPKMNRDFATRGLPSPICFFITKTQELKQRWLFSPLVGDLS